jgi:PAS domain S-box-containing protein
METIGLSERSGTTGSIADELGPEAYRAMYEQSPDGVLFTAPDGRVLAANPAACEILGRTESDICSLGRQGLADHSDDRWGVLLAERARAGHARGVARMIRGDGAHIEVEMSARIFTEAGGQQRTCTVIRDVTERVRMESELVESRASLAEAERIAQMGSCEWDLISDQTTCSEGLLRIYGISRDEFDASFEGGLRSIYPDDRELFRNTLESAIAQRSSFTVEYRAIRPDGRVRTFRSHGDVVVDGTGRPTRLVAVVQDITEARLAQEALQSTSADLERHANELQQLAVRAGSEEVSVPHAALTPRQFEILRLIARGLTNAAIAERLVVTEGTVKWHVKQILTKTGSANRAEAVARVLGEPRSHT